ncbi:MAG: AAA family ATPase, partial [Ignavibacteria bacterium]|nr:AAA family ATPase [Ignavibacteria bacterium]
TDRQFTLTDRNDRERIETVAGLPSIALVVVDSLSGGHTLDENSSQTGSVMQWLSSLAKKTGKPFLIVHHMNKSGMGHMNKSGMGKSNEPPTLSAIRGSTALLQHARVIWTLDCPDATRSSELRLACAKSNLAQKPKPIRIDIDTLGRLQWLGGYESPHDETDRMIRDCAKQNPNLTIDQIAAMAKCSPTTVATILRTQPPEPTLPTFAF